MDIEFDKSIKIIENTILSDNKDLFDKFPIDFYFLKIKNFSKTSLCYNVIPSDLLELFKNIENNFGKPSLINYHKLALTYLIKDALIVLNNNVFPFAIKNYYYKCFSKIISGIINNKGNFDYTNDIFLKDLGICSMKLIPTGPQFLEVTGLSRKFFILGSFKQFFDSLIFYFTKMKGTFPFYQMHMDVRFLREFNRIGFHNSYLRISQLLKLNGHIKGIYARAWLYDPALADISPKFTFLRDVLNYGAKIFYSGSNTSDVENALTRSKTRKEFYDKGKYMPAGYVMIWNRRDLLNWAGSQVFINR